MKAALSPPVWLLYDFLMRQGGAEYTTAVMQQAFHGRICTAFMESGSLLPIDPADVRLLSRQYRFPGLPTLDGLRAFRFGTGFLRSYKGPVIYSGSNAVTAVHNHPGGCNIHYCHTIPRFAYDMRDYYRNTVPVWQQPLFDMLVQLVRLTYSRAVRRMDVTLVNSENVRRRLKHFLGHDAEVVHPPVETGRFRRIEDGDFYLSTARLESYKRVSLIIDAFRRLPDRKLVVASSGSQEAALREQARGAHNISFTGWISDEALRDLMGRCLATVYMPIDEDFGISPVESMAAGKPVIGAAEGGILETVVDGETGCLCDPDTEALTEAVIRLDRRRALSMRESCELRAKLFDRSIFIDSLSRYLT